MPLYACEILKKNSFVLSNYSIDSFFFQSNPIFGSFFYSIILIMQNEIHQWNFTIFLSTFFFLLYFYNKLALKKKKAMKKENEGKKKMKTNYLFEIYEKF